MLFTIDNIFRHGEAPGTIYSSSWVPESIYSAKGALQYQDRVKPQSKSTLLDGSPHPFIVLNGLQDMKTG